MGFGNSKKEKEIPVEKPPKAGEIKIYIQICQKKIALFRNKKIHSIKSKISEVIGYLEKKNIDVAKTKMESIMRDEDAIYAYDILDPIIQILLERIFYIDSSTECPADLRTQLDTIIYASSRLEIEEFLTLKDLIRRKYGLAYITKAENNADSLVNQNLVEKLQVKLPTEELLMIRLKQLCREKKIKFDFLDDICQVPENIGNPPEGQGINPYGDENNFNPYEHSSFNEPAPNNINPYGPPQNNNNPYGNSQNFNNNKSQLEFPQNNNNPYGPSQDYNNNQSGFPQNNNNQNGSYLNFDKQSGFPQNDNNPYDRPSKNNNQNEFPQSNNSFNQSKNNNIKNPFSQSQIQNYSVAPLSNKNENLPQNNNEFSENKSQSKNEFSDNKSQSKNEFSDNKSQSKNNIEFSENKSQSKNNIEFSNNLSQSKNYKEVSDNISQSKKDNNQDLTKDSQIFSNQENNLNKNMSIQSNQSIGKSCVFQSKIVIDMSKSNINNAKDNQKNDNNKDKNDEYDRQKTNINYSLKRDYTHDDAPMQKKETKGIDDNFFRTETKFNPQKNEDQNNEVKGE